jgi:hypothetical protein
MAAFTQDSEFADVMGDINLPIHPPGANDLESKL